MQMLWRLSAVLLALNVGVGLSSQAMAVGRSCEQISKACADAGFTKGGAKQGVGLIDDCIDPIMQGTSAAGKAVKPVPIIDRQLVAACRAADPTFGNKQGAGSQGAAAPARPVAEAVQPCASRDDSPPSGLVVVLPPGRSGEKSLNLQSLANPFIRGVALQVDWRDIEPAEGQPDWSTLDKLFAAAESSKKWVQLLIFPGFFSPAWALAGAKTDQFPIQYGPGQGTVASLPMPWDPVYLKRWFGFLKQLSERYGRSPAFRMIAAAGPTSVSAEMTLPSKPEDVTKWLNDSYTPDKYLAAWKQVFRVYADDFPNQCVSLSAPGLPILNPGKTDRGERMRAQQEIIKQATGILGRRLALQWSDLHAGAAEPHPEEHDLVVSYSGRAITGLQMRTSAENSSGVMGADGNPPLALRRSIDLGMKPNNAGQYVNYLEIYEPDVLSGEMQPVLQYGASLFINPTRNSH
jgi:hypothetical protein